jgi:hypothetical protein
MKLGRCCGILLVACLLQASSTDAQTSLSRQRKPADTVRKGNCPAAVPPTANDSVAGAADYIELKRGGCNGECAAYTVRLYGDGIVRWHGEHGVATLAQASDLVDGTAARALMQRFADRGFWAICAYYDRGTKDASEITTVLSLAGHTKQVEDLAAAAPSWLRELDLDIDRVGNTHAWRHGGPDEETFDADRLAVDAQIPKAGVTQLMKAAALPSAGETYRILKLLSDVNEGDSSGWTALMYASQAGSVESMVALLSAGADPNARTHAGESPVFAAVQSARDTELRFKLLHDAGADINARDNHGVTPLMLACRYYWRPRLVATLLELGADPSKRDDRGRLALDYLQAAGPANGEEDYRIIRELLLRKY